MRNNHPKLHEDAQRLLATSGDYQHTLCAKYCSASKQAVRNWYSGKGVQQIHHRERIAAWFEEVFDLDCWTGEIIAEPVITQLPEVVTRERLVVLKKLSDALKSLNPNELNIVLTFAEVA